MQNNKSKLSFKYAMFWLLWGLIWWIIGQVINKPINISLILMFSVATFISAPLAYIVANKSFKEITIVDFCIGMTVLSSLVRNRTLNYNIIFFISFKKF